MKKILIVSIVRHEDEDSGQITSVFFLLECSKKEEIEIHDTLTSTRNPNVLLETILYYMDPQEQEIIKTGFHVFADQIRQCDTIKVSFLPQEESCGEDCELCTWNKIAQRDSNIIKSMIDYISTAETPGWEASLFTCKKKNEIWEILDEESFKLLLLNG